MDSRRILFARFRLQHESLRQFKVFVMDFPYWNAIDQFLAVIAKNPARQKEDYPFSDDERYLPFRRLNSALVLSFTDVIQGFETYSGKYKGVSSGQWFDNRRMIAFALQSDEAEAMKPDTNRIAYIVEEWLSEWVETCFKNGRFGNELTLNSKAGQQAYKTLIDTVRNTPITWDEINAADLWEQQTTRDTQPLHKLAYNALPSIIASLFIANTNGKTLEVQGVEKSLPIHEWWLMQQGGSDNKHLAVVSEPITWLTKKKEGKFSYLLEFVVQTQAGSNNPWVAVYIRIRRWGTKPLKVKKPDRDISVYLRSRSAWIDGWFFSGTLVQLKLAGTYYKNKKKIQSDLSWQDNPSSLIQRLNGGKGRGLAKPEDIVGHPSAYQSGAASNQHEYYILHAEGMDYEGAGKGHPVNTGLALKERGQFMDFIIKNLQGYLIPDTPMKVDAEATLQVKSAKGEHSIRGNPIEAMFTHEDLESVSLLKRGATDEEKIRKKMQVTVDALMRASGNRKIRILTFYRGDGGRLVLPHYTRQILFLNDDTELPPTIELVPPIYIPSTLGDVPAKLYKEKSNKSDKRRYIQKEWRDKRDKWVEFLNQYVEDDAYYLAFIEMDDAQSGLEDCSDWLKQAIRNAAIQVGINTQMINSIPADALHKEKTLQRAGDLSRVINANNDLILRQTALSYGLPPQTYYLAGLDEDMANSLITIGLYRYSANKPVNIDYPLAVVSTPNGETWVILPDEGGNACEPIRYIEAGIHIGQVFAKGDKQLFNYYNETRENNAYRLRRFVEQLLLKANSWNQPCLMLMEAEWRKYNVLPISNEKLEYNELAINNNTYTPEDLPNLRLLRMRDAGTMNETPQYVELREGETWQDSHDADDPEGMTGVEDKHCGSDFLHYFSIGRQPATIIEHFKKVKKKGLIGNWNEQSTFEANEAHKHQQAIEFVPFFMQSGDDKLAYCRIAHFLRYSPAWRGGNLVLPHQLHLAKTLLDDLRDVFEPKSK